MCAQWVLSALLRASNRICEICIYGKPNTRIMCTRRRRISFYSFFRCCLPIYERTWEAEIILRSNGYLLICVVLYPRSFVRCACVICHIVGDLYTRVLRGRNRKQPFHSSKTNMKTKQNQRKQTSRWCSIRTNDCALLFGFSVQWLVEWRTSINALHNFQLERFFGSSHSCSLQSKSTYWPHCIRSGFYSVSWIGQCLCWSLNKCAQSTFSRTSSDRAPFYSQTHQTSASTENHYSFSKSCEVISSGTLRSKIDSFQIDYFRTENSNYFRSFSAFNSFLEFSSRHDRRNTIDYTLLIIKKNR